MRTDIIDEYREKVEAIGLGQDHKDQLLFDIQRLDQYPDDSTEFAVLKGYLDTIFSWLVVNVGGIFWSDRSITEIFPRGDVLMSLPHLKLALIGIVIVGALLMSSKGLLPEVPSRPKRPVGLSMNLDEEKSAKL